jgi:hypothetical protein
MTKVLVKKESYKIVQASFEFYDQKGFGLVLIGVVRGY